MQYATGSGRQFNLRNEPIAARSDADGPRRPIESRLRVFERSDPAGV